MIVRSDQIRGRIDQRSVQIKSDCEALHRFAFLWSVGRMPLAFVVNII
jgi:hypothetical protein